VRVDGDPSPETARFGERASFLKEEVYDVCSALALSESVLRQIGLLSEADYLGVVFDLVEGRLAQAQPSAESPSALSAPSPSS
jgi:hypothetical protein